MVKKLCWIFVCFLCLNALEAGPSSVFWTNCTTACVHPNMWSLGYSGCSSPHHRGSHSSFPPDVSAEYGFLVGEKIQGECGVDVCMNTAHPLFFNGKMGMNESPLFSGAPSFSLGIFNVGTESHGEKRTNQNIMNVVFGHTLPECIGGTAYVGGFSGSKAMGKNRQGV